MSLRWRTCVFLERCGAIWVALNEGRAGADGFLAQNIYEWEAQAMGNCEEVGGCISLISSGTSREESAFLDASEMTVTCSS